LEIISEVMLHLHVELVWICNARCLGVIGRKNMSCIPERALGTCLPWPFLSLKSWIL